MAVTQILSIVRKAFPVIAKQLPRLWPLLLETKNRQRLVEAGKDLASQSPVRRLRGRIEVTATIADGIAADAKTDDERRRADEWVRRAKNLSRRLDMPVAGHADRSAHRASIQQQLDGLQKEMNDYLGR